MLRSVENMTMKKTWSFFAVAWGMLLAHDAFAKAYYAGKAEMIQKADVIVVVNISKVEKVEVKPESGWTYRQKATGQIEQSIKGGLSGQIEILGQEDFICAQCDFKPVRCLLFLKKGGKDFLHGANWHLGIRPIKDDKVDWFKDDKSLFEMTPQPLSDVIKEIESVLKEKAPNKPSEATP